MTIHFILTDENEDNFLETSLLTTWLNSDERDSRIQDFKNRKLTEID